ncbi:hypothetical protein WCD74_16955 [Actinomycetospora sp. OC33-EN08]|uniref:Zinc ribbon domain-containing protein n=1 Tax=Actinomycetospora aurantiaca TaxID=3129233 RepID=A0ABU8MQ71_9PSEU
MIVMQRCRCGASLVPDLHFCVSCGARRQLAPRVPAMAGAGAGPVGYPAPTAYPAHPAPRPVLAMPPRPAPMPVPVVPRQAEARRSIAPWVVASVAILAAVVLVGVAAISLALRPTTVTAAPAPVVAPTVTVGVPVPANASGTGSESGTSAGSSSTSGAASTLQSQVEADRARVAALAGQWVPQLSAKHDGTVADGITYDDAAIWSHYTSLTARFPSAALLYSGDWPVFKGTDYWVVVYPQSFPTADAANAWCDAQGFAADDCLAKRLSYTGGPEGSTKARS